MFRPMIMTKRTLYALAGAILQPLALALTPALAAAGATGAPCAQCAAVIIGPGQARVLPARLAGLDVLVRLIPGDETAARRAVEDIAARDGRPGLVVRGVPDAAIDADLVRRTRMLIVDVSDLQPDDRLAYRLKLRVTEARAAGPGGTDIGLSAPPATLTALFKHDLGPYVDFLVTDGPLPAEFAAYRVWRGRPPSAGELPPLSDLLRATEGGDAERWLWRAPDDPATFAARLGDLVRAAPLLPPGLVSSPTGVTVTCDGVPLATYLNPSTLDTIAVARGCTAIATNPRMNGIERVTTAGGDTVVRVPSAQAGDRFAEGLQVVGSRRLTVAEILARHQAAAARQAATVRTLISAGTLTLSFEAPGFAAPVTISAETIVYTSPGRTELQQRDIRVNGLAFTGGGVPRLPIIEPERVAAPPLTITLTGVYRYRLVGRDTKGGADCYVVAFEPVDPTRPLFRGRAWIGVTDFAMVRVAAVQTGLRGPILSSEQIDEFRKEEGRVWLLSRSDVRQVYEGAAHRTPIHRVLAIARHEINPADFAKRVEAAYASNAVMLRDTPEGYGSRGGGKARGGEPAAAPVVGGAASRVRTLAAGVIIDPNITRPLPFAGLSYVDFNLLGTGAQLNAFFGGTYGQLAFSVPALGRTRWQLAGRGFGIASSYNDRAFVNGRERYEQDIRQRPAAASVWLLRALSPRISARIGYDLDYTRFAAGEATGPSFVVPADQLVHGLRLALDAQRGGWNASVWWNPARRTGWRAWGTPASGEYAPGHRDFQRLGASLVRSVVVSPRLVARLEAAIMSGRDLDRFSRYSFGTFDNRLRGYPSALIRYDRGGVVRSALAFAAAKAIRADLFLDSAEVHDPGFGRGLRNYTGLGAALEAPAPFGTLVAVEWGYGFRGINANGRVGTQVVRISGYKIF